MAVDGQAGEDRHQSQRPGEHRDWVESLGGAAAALTDSQLERWPPSSLWTRLTALCVDLRPPSRKQVAAAIAQRMYPHPDTDLCPGGHPPSQVQIAADTSLDHTTVGAAMDDLEEHGWVKLDRGPGRAFPIVLTVPELVRVDGVLEEHGARSEGRVQYAEPLRESERLDREPLRESERLGANLSENPRGSEVDGASDAEPLRESERLPDSASGPNGATSQTVREVPLRESENTAGAVGNPNPLPTEPVEKMSTGRAREGLIRVRELAQCSRGDGETLMRDGSGRAWHPSCWERVS